MAFSLVLHGSVPKDEICGVIVGHCAYWVFFMPCLEIFIIGTVSIPVRASADRFPVVWYFFSDVYPSLHDGQRPLDPPSWWRRIFEGRAVETDAQPINNDIAAAAAPEVR